MKTSQLLFDFGKTVMKHLRLLPDAPAVKPVSPRRSHLSRDPILEKLSRHLLREAGCRDLVVQVVWNRRLRTTAGLACWTKKTVYLNPQLIEVSPTEVQRTLRHELAHFLAQYRAGRRRIAAHGPEWRQACRDLGIPRESRCHDLPFKRTKMERRFFYECPQCRTRLARVRKPRRPVACLSCCRKHNGGRYDERFRFVSVPAPERAAA
jgi:predicted SprT family Zn-dependent metalloprotease